MKRAVLIFAAMCVAWLSFGIQDTAAAGISAQVTLYDLERDAAQPVAVGRGALTPAERKAQMYVVSSDPQMSGRGYERDVFYFKRTGYEPQTGAIRFRVRHEQIVENRCTAMEIREYTLRLGESCELYSERGHIRAVMKFV